MPKKPFLSLLIESPTSLGWSTLHGAATIIVTVCLERGDAFSVRPLCRLSIRATAPPYAFFWMVPMRMERARVRVHETPPTQAITVDKVSHLLLISEGRALLKP